MEFDFNKKAQAGVVLILIIVLVLIMLGIVFIYGGGVTGDVVEKNALVLGDYGDELKVKEKDLINKSGDIGSLEEGKIFKKRRSGGGSSSSSDTGGLEAHIEFPEIKIISPADGSFINASLIDLNYSVIGEHISYCAYSIDDGDWINLADCANTSLSFSDGQHNITVKAVNIRDRFSQQTVSFVVDNNHYSCSDDQLIMNLYSLFNTHGEVWNGPNYDVEICYDEIFGLDYAGSNVHDCNGTNEVLRLNETTNSHAAQPGDLSYNEPVCYGDLVCSARSSGCLGDELKIVGLQYLSNSHIEVRSADNYGVYICCVSGFAG